MKLTVIVERCCGEGLERAWSTFAYGPRRTPPLLGNVTVHFNATGIRQLQALFGS